MSLSPDEFEAELWSYANEVPMGQHPWFQGILQHRWSHEQIILGEVQHYLRVHNTEQLLDVHIQGVGDHARGLFEVGPSVAPSAHHALENVPAWLFHARSRHE